jgi:hypothetical protein
MYKTISEFNFREAFTVRPDNFSYAGLTALYEYLTQLEEDTGQEIELDPIALCCDFTEYPNIIDAASEYFGFEGMTYDPENGGELKTVDEVEKEAREFLEDKTTVIDCHNGHVIIQNF